MSFRKLSFIALILALLTAILPVTDTEAASLFTEKHGQLSVKKASLWIKMVRQCS